MPILNKMITFFGMFVGWLIYLNSYLIKREQKIWIFGSFGIFNDNSRYLYEHCLQYSDIRPIWISKNKKSVAKAAEKGEAYYFWSLKGFYYSLKGSIYIYSSYLSDISFYTSNKALKVNLWHGIPLKKIEFDINSAPLVFKFRKASWLYRLSHPSQHTIPDLLLSPSHYVSDYSFKSAFRVKDSHIIHAMYPRVTELIKSNTLQEFSDFKNVFLYAPTWRDDGTDFINVSGIDFTTLNNILKLNNSILLIKLHPSTKLALKFKFSNINIVDNQIDPIALMKSANCLITDYSSIYFDYLYLNRPIIFFPFDKEKYLENREMYFAYDDATPGILALNSKELITAIQSVMEGKDFSAHERTDCFKSFGLEHLGNEYIIQQIKRTYQEWRH